MPLSSPPTSEAGQVVPHDHPELSRTDVVIRRISSEWVVEKNGRKRLSSIAFNPSSDGSGMSIDIERLIVEKGLEPAIYVTTPAHVASVTFEIGDARNAGLLVGYYPLPDNDCHGAVWGHFHRDQKRALAAASSWLVSLPGIEIA
jgi:hypothetical protein